MGTSTDSMVVLRDTTNEPERYKTYMTLSHRWSQERILRLESTNLTYFTNGVPISALPKTFQDAVLVTRKIGLRYLWIDALCIIQGPSRDDWMAEAPRMADIYSHSFGNITALWAEATSAGFLDSNLSDLPFVSKVKFAWCGAERSDHILIKTNVWPELILDAPLNKRGWVLQEAILAPRQIYFTKSHVFWECRETIWLDIFPKQLPPNIELRLIGRPDIFELKDKVGAETRNLHDVWTKLLGQYSERSLTYLEDKLVAIAGVAQKFHTLCPDDEYVVGMWRSDLLQSLLWSVQDPPRSHHLILPLTAGEHEYRAPSWSVVPCQI